MRTRRMFFLGVCACACTALAAGEWDVTLGDFPRLRGETDDAARIQRAVDATGHGRVLCLPQGLYEVARTVWVTNGASLLLHKSANVRATAKMEHIFHIDRPSAWANPAKGDAYDQGPFFKGGHLDGNGLASCLFLNHYFHFTVRDTVFVNGFPYGFHVGPRGCEIVADNLYFRTIRSGLAGNVALFSEGNDSYYSNIVVVDYTVGLKTLGGANAFNHYHVWGGPVPPVAKGRLPEMLENSVCFDLGGHMNMLRDSYADTGAIGFKVSGWGQQIVGCWFLNNTHFGLKDITIVEQDPGSVDLLIADCCFRASGPETKLYRGPGAVRWRDMVYRGFADDVALPAEIVTGRVCDCKTADEWNFVPEKIAFVSPAGEFAEKGSARAIQVSVPRKLVNARFPKAGAGTGVVFRIRSTDEATKEVEFAFKQSDGYAWGTHLPITPEWREVRLPFDELRYFGHWVRKPLPAGVRPDARKIVLFSFMYGNWISRGTADQAHGFELDSLRIVGR